MCNREAGGIRYGRVVKPGPETHGFSVDVVDMKDCAGPHHVHPNGEIDLVMPLEGPAVFDGRARAGRCTSPEAITFRPCAAAARWSCICFPEGAIQFTGKQPKERWMTEPAATTTSAVAGSRARAPARPCTTR